MRQRRIRIGVDMHVFDGKFQGSRSYLLGIYGELTRLCPEFDFVFLLGQPERLAAVEGFAGPNVQCVRMKPSSAVVRLAWHLPRLRRRLRLDLLHTQWVIPLWPARGNVVTTHDLLFESHPQFFGKLFVLRSRVLMRRSVRKADSVLTISEFSRQEIATRYGVPLEKVSLAFPAADRAKFLPGEAGRELVLARGLVPGGYLLTVGRIEPRKNHVTMLRAYRRLAGDPPPLVIVGQRDFGVAEFERELAQMPPERRVIVLSDVTDAELPALYRHAMVFLYPSWAEGFGMPPLEAMASGVPVITSNVTAIPEVVGSAGLSVDPSSPSQLAEAMQSLVDDPERRQGFAAAGLARCGIYTWKASATVLAQLYRRFFQSEFGDGENSRRS